MASIVVNPATASSITLSYCVRVQYENDQPDYGLVRFPSMHGALVQRGGRKYLRAKCSAWILDTAVTSLATALAALVGAASDTVTINDDTGGSSQLKRCVQVGAMTTNRSFMGAYQMFREVEFTVETVR